MKIRIFFSAIVLLLFFLSSCSSDNEDIDRFMDNWTAQTVLKLLSTTWVYDKPLENSWEKNQFKESGIFNSSYYDQSLYEIQGEVSGRFSLDTKGNIVGQYKLSSGTLMNLDWSILLISDFELSIKNNTAGLEFTYSKLLEEINLNSGDSETPDYERLIPDTITVYKNIGKGEMALPQIKGYMSHNKRIAEVDAYTGEIKALSSGCTYIDVITTEGTAVVEVNVTSILPYDYCEFLGTGRDEIYNKFGQLPYTDTDKQIMYLLSEGDFGYLVFNFDTWTDQVNAVSVMAKENPSFTNDEMQEYLNSTYYIYEKGVTDTQYTYINAETYDKATAGIVWDPKDRQLIIVSISHDLFTDYSPLLGKTKEEVLSLMDETPFKDTDAYIAYGLDNKYLDIACLYYTFDFITYSPTVQVIILSVKEGANRNEIIDFLNSKYVFREKESTDNNRIYLTVDGKLAIEYNLEYNQIWYYKNENTLGTKAMKSNHVNLL